MICKSQWLCPLTSFNQSWTQSYCVHAVPQAAGWLKQLPPLCPWASHSTQHPAALPDSGNCVCTGSSSGVNVKQDGADILWINKGNEKILKAMKNRLNYINETHPRSSSLTFHQFVLLFTPLTSAAQQISNTKLEQQWSDADQLTRFLVQIIYYV